MNKFIAIIITAAILASTLLGGLIALLPQEAAAFGGGNGSVGTPWLIENLADLQAMSNDLSAHYALANNIDLSIIEHSTWNGGNGFLPIGDLTTKFTGSFDGNGHTISGLFIDRPDTDFVGLFGCVEGGTVKNVTLSGVDITGSAFVGGLVGDNRDGTIEYSSATGNVTGTGSSVGGLVGDNWQGTVINSSAAGTVNGSDDYVGGLVGRNEDGTVNNSSATCNVSGQTDVGGLVGLILNGTVNNSHATGTVNGSCSVGGLAGYNSGTVNNSYATGNVEATSGLGTVGGLVGYMPTQGSVSKSYATGTVNAPVDSNYAGGLVGRISGGSVIESYAAGAVNGHNRVGGLAGGSDAGGTVNNSYATGSVTGTGWVGGLLGQIYEDSMVSNSYAIGSVNGTTDTGGLVGKLSSGTVNASFYDLETTGWNDTGKGEPKTTAQMKTLATFTTAPADWNIGTSATNLNNGYPFLSWQISGNSPVWYICTTCTTPITEAWVDDDYTSGGYNDDHTWGVDAFDKIQDGIDAVSGSTVYVAAGTYKENIVLKDGVELLGAGSASTIIDGMKNGSVITATNCGNTTVVDGFTVTNGSANKGGGMYNYYSSPDITNCSFQNNTATNKGGGMYNDESFPDVTNCTFSNNSAAYDGGGMFNVDGSPTITNCTFSNNSATRGGGLFNSESEATVTNCTFTGNSAEENGGGMCSVDSSPAVTNCTFIDNSAKWNGGGMYNYDASPTINGCTFDSNVADFGGGMYNYYSSPNVSKCTFTGNSAGETGGGMHNSGYAPVITNCLFTNNSATNNGGGMSNDNSSSIITNCTFYNNSAINNGGGIYKCIEYTQPVITNCILWGDTPNEIYITSGTIDVTYSDVQGNLYPGTGNINASPQFIDALGGNLRLSAGSPCIDTGSNASVPVWLTTDLDGNNRIIDGNNNGTPTVDMGAYERIFVPAPTPTPAPAFNDYGGGGGGGGGGSTLTAVLNVLGNGQSFEISSDGYFMQDASVPSQDGSVTVSIPAMTQALGPNGLPVTQITVNTVDPPPAPDGMHILAAFSFQPGGATFSSPGVQITITFDPSQVAEGETVAIAFFNEATQSWETVEGTVSGGTATFSIDHFTVFAVMAGTIDESTDDAEPTPAPASAASSSPHDSGGMSAAAWGGIAVGIILIILIAILLFRRRMINY